MTQPNEVTMLNMTEIHTLSQEGVIEYAKLLQEDSKLRAELQEEAENTHVCSGFGVSSSTPVGIAIAAALSLKADADAQDVLAEELTSFRKKWGLATASIPGN